MKKFLSLVLCISVVLSLFSFSAVAETDSDILNGENIYTVDFRTYEKLDLSVYEGLEAPFDFYGVPIRNIVLLFDTSGNTNVIVPTYTYRLTLNKNDIRPPKAKLALAANDELWGVMVNDPNVAVFDIDFTERIFKSELTDSFHTTLIRNAQELEYFILICDNEDGQNEFVEYALSLPENFFDEKAIFITKTVLESNAQFMVEKMSVGEGVSVHMNYAYIEPETKSDYTQTYLITAEVNQSDVLAVETAKAVMTVLSEDNIDFDYQYFGTIGTPADATDFNHSAKTLPTLVKSFDELDEFVNMVSELCDVDFLTYVSSLPESFFDEKALLLVWAFAPNTGYGYNVTALKASDEGLRLSYGHSGGYATALGNTVIAVEFKKSDAKNLDNVLLPLVSNIDSVYIESSVPKPEPDTVGDVNGDYYINTEDYILLKRLYFGTSQYKAYGEMTKQRADIDRNGIITADDYILMKRVCFGTYKIG